MKRQTNFFLLFFILLSAFLLLVSKYSPVYSLSGFVQKIILLPKPFFYSLKTRLFSSKKNLSPEQAEKLAAENASLLLKLVDYETLKKDNQALKSQLENSAVKSYDLLPARVIGFLGRFDFPSVLIIDQGEENGVKLGMAIVYENNLVGVVAKVSKNVSQVMLPGNENFSLVGRTVSGKATGVIKGKQDFILFDRIPITDELSDGDLVITAGDMNKPEYQIASGFVVGKILAVNKTESKPFQNAKIASLLDYARIQRVFVVNK